MSADHYKEDMHRWLEALNRKDQGLLDTLADEFYAADCVLHDPGFPNLPPGPTGVRQFTRKILADAGPDMHVTLEDMIVEGDSVAVRLTVHDTEVPTGKPVRATVLDTCHYSGGKIAEEWELVGAPGS